MTDPEPDRPSSTDRGDAVQATVEAAAATVGEVAVILGNAVREIAAVLGGLATEVAAIQESSATAAGSQTPAPADTDSHVPD